MSWKQKSKGPLNLSRIVFAPTGIQRDGKFLHSQRDPLREAGLWVSEKPKTVQGVIFVLGLGATYHVNEWQRQRPDLTFVICDFETELFTTAQISMTTFSEVARLPAGRFGLQLNEDLSWWDDFEDSRDSLLHIGYSVFRFRAAWMGREKDFTWFEDCLLDRSLEAVSKSLGVSGQDNGFDLNIKSLTQDSLLLEDDTEKKVLLALRELVT